MSHCTALNLLLVVVVVMAVPLWLVIWVVDMQRQEQK
jgi:hypothetical protein